jgi:hypothetical protein
MVASDAQLWHGALIQLCTEHDYYLMAILCSSIDQFAEGLHAFVSCTEETACRVALLHARRRRGGLLPLESSTGVFRIGRDTYITWSRVTPARWVRLSAPSHASVPALAHKTLRYERVHTHNTSDRVCRGRSHSSTRRVDLVQSRRRKQRRSPVTCLHTGIDDVAAYYCEL